VTGQVTIIRIIDMEKPLRMTHADTWEAIDKSMKETGIDKRIERAINNLKAARRAAGLPVDGNDRGDTSSGTKDNIRG